MFSVQDIAEPMSIEIYQQETLVAHSGFPLHDIILQPQAVQIRTPLQTQGPEGDWRIPLFNAWTLDLILGAGDAQQHHLLKV